MVCYYATPAEPQKDLHPSRYATINGFCVVLEGADGTLTLDTTYTFLPPPILRNTPTEAVGFWATSILLSPA
jgi:hypothetical protein